MRDVEIIDFFTKRIERSEGGIDSNLIPTSNRLSAPILGSWTTHERNELYGPRGTLQAIIEEKINCSGSNCYLILFYSQRNIGVRRYADFSYDILREIKLLENCIDVVFVDIDSDGLIVFHEDDPACYISYTDNVNFESNFISHREALEIYSENALDWIIYESDAQKEWINMIRRRVN